MARHCAPTTGFLSSVRVVPGARPAASGSVRHLGVSAVLSQGRDGAGSRTGDVRIVGAVAPTLGDHMPVRVAAIPVVIGLLLAGALGACTPPASYVALGDSFTAGPLIAPQDRAVPGCLRSDVNYPSLIAPGLRQPAFRDVSCSGARTRDMTSAQDVQPDPDNPPQLRAVDQTTELVTLGIGGNDIGFTEIAQTCVRLAVGDPLGSPCRAHYTAGGVDQIAARIDALRPRLRTVLEEIVRRAPRAKVLVIGYPAILPETTATFALCQPTLPIAVGDVAYLREEVQKRLNATIRRVARAQGHIYVDTYTPSIGHDACQPPTVRWVEPLVPAADAAPVHPNRLGMQAMADIVRTTLRSHGLMS